MSEKDKTLKKADSDELEKTSGFKVTKGEDGVVRITITKGVSENIMGVQDEKLAMCLQDQITRCILITDRDNPVDLIHSKMYLIKGLEPTNELEALLVTQMTSVHFMAMDMMRRAMIKDQTVAGTTDNINRANKLLSLFTRQAETLQKLRGKGQQSITVKHVNVSGGGQAIVGDVHHKGGGVMGKWKGPPHSKIKRCGARNRAGKPCGNYAMKNGRCRFHGGKSTGPRTREGKKRAAKANLKHGG